MSRATWIGGAVTVVLSLLAAIALFQAYGASADARATVRGFAILSDRAVRVDFEVVKDAADTALCEVRSRGTDGEEVGSALVRVGPSEDGVVRQSYELATSAPPVTGEVEGCTVEGAQP